MKTRIPASRARARHPAAASARRASARRPRAGRSRPGTLPSLPRGASTRRDDCATWTATPSPSPIAVPASGDEQVDALVEHAAVGGRDHEHVRAGAERDEPDLHLLRAPCPRRASIACCAAPSRDGFTSDARIEPETSTSSTSVARWAGVADARARTSERRRRGGEREQEERERDPPPRSAAAVERHRSEHVEIRERDRVAARGAGRARSRAPRTSGTSSSSSEQVRRRRSSRRALRADLDDRVHVDRQPRRSPTPSPPPAPTITVCRRHERRVGEIRRLLRPEGDRTATTPTSSSSGRQVDPRRTARSRARSPRSASATRAPARPASRARGDRRAAAAALRRHAAEQRLERFACAARSRPRGRARSASSSRPADTGAPSAPSNDDAHRARGRLRVEAADDAPAARAA